MLPLLTGQHMARPWESALHFEPTHGLNLPPECRAKSARKCQVVPLPRVPVPCLPLLRPPVGLVATPALLGSEVPVLPLRSVRVPLVLLPSQALSCYRCCFPRSRLAGSVLLLPLSRRSLVLALLLLRHRSATAPLDFLGPEILLRVFPVRVVRCWLVLLQPVALHHL